jgi:hypothetical protein
MSKQVVRISFLAEIEVAYDPEELFKDTPEAKACRQNYIRIARRSAFVAISNHAEDLTPVTEPRVEIIDPQKG